MADEPLSQEAIEALLAAAHEPEPQPVFDEPAPVAAAAEAAAPAPGPGSAVGLLEHPPEPLVEGVLLDDLHALEAPLAAEADIDLLMDVPLGIAVELGQATVTIRELLDLGQGSVLRLNRRAGEPVDVLVNGQVLARGEVVIYDEDFGIRITDVVSKADRVRSMG